MYKFNKYLIIVIIQLLFAHTYADTQNIYITNLGSNSISVIGFKKTQSLKPQMYLQDIWENPNRINVFSKSVLINKYNNKYGYIYSGAYQKRLIFEDNGNISSVIDEPSSFYYVKDMFFGPDYSKSLQDKMYVFGGGGIDGYNMQFEMYNQRPLGSLKLEDFILSDRTGQSISSAVVADNAKGFFKAYILYHGSSGINAIRVYNVDSNGHIFFDTLIQDIELTDKSFGSFAVMPGANPKYIFLPVNDRRALMIFERKSDGVLNFKSWLLTGDKTPIKVIPSEDGKFIFVLTQDRIIRAYLVPKNEGEIFRLIGEYDLSHWIGGEFVDGAVGSVSIKGSSRKYIFVLVNGANKILSYEILESGELDGTPQTISTGGYSSEYMSLRNSQ
jgi:hypothetical protein